MTAKELLAIAKNEVGIKENPANSNSVKYNTWMYGKSVQDGIPKGASYPWCAAFVSWCFRGTGLCPKTASCLNMLEWFEKNGQIVKEPRPGDIVFFKYSTNKRRTNHVGIVVAVNGKIINTYEGNTSASGSQDNGGMVMQKNRHSNIVAFARPKYEESNIHDIALEVISGKWGTGAERKQKLTQAGYNYSEVQAEVNRILKP